MRFKMQATKYLIGLLLVVVSCQNAQLKELPSEASFEIFFDDTLQSRAVLTENDKRNIKDVWNNIKNSIQNAWNGLQLFAKNSKQKINKMKQKVKARADEVIKSFENHMNNLKKKLNDVIKTIFDETEIVKKCLVEERELINNVIKEVLQNLSVCITKNMKNLSLLDGSSIRIFDDTEFFKDLENKFKMCEQDIDNVEECLNQVRKDAFADMENMEADIVKNSVESQNLADDILETLIMCSIDAIIEASSSITLEVLQIARCIING